MNPGPLGVKEPYNPVNFAIRPLIETAILQGHIEADNNRELARKMATSAPKQEQEKNEKESK